jgi:hypothetical protein
MTLSPALTIEILRQLLPDGFEIVNATEIQALREIGGDELLTEAWVSEDLEVSTSTLRAWRANGSGPPFVKFKGIRCPRYPRSDYIEWKARVKRLKSNSELGKVG